jgi:predicted 3-demethylubiquinone-9 3-methyltransferase (glyoxalase superfamily)
MTKQIYPCLWFDGQAREAAEFYCAIFSHSKITADNSLVVKWEINGKEFMGLNGGSKCKANEAISFVVECDTQSEIDFYWSSLIADGGTESQCGWCRDRFGVSWQIVPSALPTLMGDPEKGQRVIAACMKMKKFDIAALLNA